MEEGRKGGEKGEGAATAASEASSGVNANPVREGVQLSEACAGSEGAPNAGGFDEDSGQDKLSQDGSESTTRSAALTDGMESIQRWLQVCFNGVVLRLTRFTLGAGLILHTWLKP